MTDRATTDNFFQAWATWDRTEPPAVFYRLYYGEQGEPLFYSMEDLPGNYIEIDQATYSVRRYDLCVKDGCLVDLPRHKVTSKLKPDGDSGTACDPRDVCVVVPESRSHTRWKKCHEN